MTLAFVDFETRSEAKLKQVGARVYAEHPSTQIMCAALALDNGPVEIWREIDEKPLLAWLNERVPAGATWVFHNCEFEMAIFRSSLGRTIPIESVIDTAAVARAANLPGKLEDLGGYLGFPKDVEGQRIMVKLARPRQPSKENRDRFWRPETKPEDFEALYRYNPRDVEVSREAYKRLPRMSDRERRIFELTWRMNERGLPIDMEAVRRMERLVLDAKAGLDRQCLERYGFVLSQTARVTEALGAHSIAKAPLRDFLKEEPGNWLAQARQAYAKASTAKLSSIRNHVASDGCVHGSVVYAGAERTVRFAGAGIQPQNFPRGYGKNSDAAFELLPYPELFTFAYDPITAISNMLRGVITRLGRKLNVADFAQIEARLLAWLAGQQDILDVFARGGDPYREMAARIYHKAVELVTDDERFMGKQAVLGCGYGLGKDGFRSLLDTTYDVQIDREEAGKIVTAYRSASPEVVKFWERVERAVSIARINPGKLIEIRAGLHLYARWESPTEFHIILPSGRRLRFVNVKWDKDKTAFGRDRASDGGYGPVKLYGGKLVGIITQSLARDIMCEAMLRLEDLGHQIILTVHDEVVSMDDDNFDQFRSVMVQSPAWLTDFPLKADTFQTERYRK